MAFRPVVTLTGAPAPPPRVVLRGGRSVVVVTPVQLGVVVRVVVRMVAAGGGSGPAASLLNVLAVQQPLSFLFHQTLHFQKLGYFQETCGREG